MLGQMHVHGGWSSGYSSGDRFTRFTRFAEAPAWLDAPAPSHVPGGRR
jgi:hypothetical protein